jgi:hypothetical protein
MKYIVFIFSAILITGCSGFNFDKAYEVSRKAAEMIQKQQYAELEEMYSHNFKNSETPEARAEKYKMIMDAVGEIKSIELMDSAAGPLNEFSEAEYKYLFKCTNMNVITKILVIEDFGDYLVASISIQQE